MLLLKRAEVTEKCPKRGAEVEARWLVWEPSGLVMSHCPGSPVSFRSCKASTWLLTEARGDQVAWGLPSRPFRSSWALQLTQTWAPGSCPSVFVSCARPSPIRVSPFQPGLTMALTARFWVIRKHIPQAHPGWFSAVWARRMRAGSAQKLQSHTCCIHGVSARLPFPAGGKDLTWLAVLVTLVTFLAPLFTLLLETLLWGRPAAQPPLWEVPQTPVYGTGSGGGWGGGQGHSPHHYWGHSWLEKSPRSLNLCRGRVMFLINSSWASLISEMFWNTQVFWKKSKYLDYGSFQSH